MGPLKFIYCNLNRSRPAHDLLRKTARDTNARLDCSNNMDCAIDVTQSPYRIVAQSTGNGFVKVGIADVFVYVCYVCSRMYRFKTFLENPRAEIGLSNRVVVIIGDFNAKSPVWGSRKAEARSNFLLDWLAALDLQVVNDGLYLTIVGQPLRTRITDWKVDERESLSDHQYITFSLQVRPATPTKSIAEI